MKKYLTEGIGAFFWVFTLVLTANNGTGSLAPMALGAVGTAMMYASELTGGHFNPAVSLALLMRGRLDRLDLPYYALAQALGGFVAALIGVFLLGCGNAGATNIQMRVNDPICALLAEFVGTFALVYVFLQTLPEPGQSRYSLHGLVTGLVVMAAHYALGPVSGGLLNPAAGVGAIASGMAVWTDIWLYIVGPVLGAAAAVTAVQAIRGTES